LSQREKAVSSVGKELVSRLKRFAKALETTKDISMRFTCRTVRLNLRPKPYDAAGVKRTRRKLGASQAIFARFLGVSLSAVRDWEQGLKPPSGAASRIMDEINHDPEYFRRRLVELSSSVEREA
jgi:DNA-binding transcriptional regulator YiaG